MLFISERHGESITFPFNPFQKPHPTKGSIPKMKKDEFRFKLDRRAFLGRAGCASLGVSSLVSTIAQLKLMQAAAANTAEGDVVGSDYKALVCLFLNGGCDMNNVVIPIGTHPSAPDASYG
jgi:hypothetical protein